MEDDKKFQTISIDEPTECAAFIVVSVNIIRRRLNRDPEFANGS